MQHAINWKTTGKWLVLLLVIFSSANAMAMGDELGAGDTHISIQVMPTIYHFPTYYEIYTDESNLLDALLGVDLIHGDRASWRLDEVTIDGTIADFEYDGEYWEITRYDKAKGHIPIETDIGDMPIRNDDSFTFSLIDSFDGFDGDIVEALAIDNLSTRSGPSNEYRETGTYNVKGEYVQLISCAYDANDICWVQCEVAYGNKLRRVYTGLKRFDTASFDLYDVIEEEPFDESVKVTATSKAMFGPGSDYGTYDSLTVDKGQTVTIITIENDYAQVEWTTTKQSYRAWVPIHTLAY